ncbi:GNAT family N-acetyltransferase [Pseudomonas sp. LS44]|uniref:GNAT family N-acetyltransferase n=1 Tax=Pseudomonas sp. LS44 TaxID=1357074 RepID=UPI00215ADA0B|nr:GNAT family N-acetyltransferase [Pseudomonas sp. LS44]UVE17565.1 GNAT family N-acetyltransferase [Pseudomonas sp. LS44]
MSVSRACATDLDELAELFAGYLDFYEMAKPRAAVRSFLEARLALQDSVLWLARDDGGQTVGFVQLYPFFSSLALQPAWLLSDLYVAPRARRHGVGETLMNVARAHAEVSGACGLMLETTKTNQVGQALYERLGYVRDELFYTYWLSLTAP